MPSDRLHARDAGEPRSADAGEPSAAELRRRQPGLPWRPFEPLVPSDHWWEERRTEVTSILGGAWSWRDRQPVDLRPPLRWRAVCEGDRSWELALHSWEPLGIVLAAYERMREPDQLEFAIGFARDWLAAHPVEGGRSELAWYDAAIGSRACRLAYLTDAAARSDAPEHDLEALLGGLLRHSDQLAEPEGFAAHSNHGMYQVMAQCSAIRRFPWIKQIVNQQEQALHRLRTLLDNQFTSEGVHREHSPEYHYLMLVMIEEVIRSGLVQEGWLEDLCRRAEESLAWFVLPDGRLAMFGDSREHCVEYPDVDGVLSEELRFVLTRGTVGSPPGDRWRAFPESGYAVFRDGWPQSPADDFPSFSYLAQTCAFHSRVHKHADDLSFVWYDRGQDLLTDAGRFGYVGRTAPRSELAQEGFWYSDPRRVYVESTRAHNTVEIDGRSHRRRGVDPYGSALVRAAQEDGLGFSEARATHGSVEHTRVLVFAPGSWLLVIDALEDRGGARHDLVQRFHFAPQLEVVEGPEAVRAVLPSSEDALHVVPLVSPDSRHLVRGQEEPELLGWISPTNGVLVPQWTLGYAVAGARRHTFATLLELSDGGMPPEREQVAIAPGAVDGRLSWSSATGERHVVLEPRGSKLEVSVIGPP